MKRNNLVFAFLCLLFFASVSFAAENKPETIFTTFTQHAMVAKVELKPATRDRVVNLPAKYSRPRTVEKASFLKRAFTAVVVKPTQKIFGSSQKAQVAKTATVKTEVVAIIAAEPVASAVTVASESIDNQKIVTTLAVNESSTQLPSVRTSSLPWEQGSRIETDVVCGSFAQFAPVAQEPGKDFEPPRLRRPPRQDQIGMEFRSSGKTPESGARPTEEQCNAPVANGDREQTHVAHGSAGVNPVFGSANSGTTPLGAVRARVVKSTVTSGGKDLDPHSASVVIVLKSGETISVPLHDFMEAMEHHELAHAKPKKKRKLVWRILIGAGRFALGAATMGFGGQYLGIATGMIQNPYLQTIANGGSELSLHALAEFLWRGGHKH